MDARVKEILERSKKVVFFGGAGVSTESNIPDFRSESGLYHAMNEYGHSPETMLSRSFFERNTEVFFDYYKKNLIYTDAEPNKAHLALAKLEEEGKLTGIVTQNIDGLHQKAGNKKVYELHGSTLRNNCMDCGKFYDLEFIMDEKNCERGVPKCPVCGGIIKPDVVLYEEPLDDSVIRGAVDAIAEADTLIVGGTSLVVYPAAGLIHYFRGKDLILINKTSTQADGEATLVIHDSIGKVLGD
ncbi:MAG: NAD-dependent protein deacylase [Firmicutes bacterium]|nr:NAD-dependent protein deacylase [Bacillota bacterium]